MPYDSPSRYKTSCDCVTSGHHSIMLIICRECNAQPQDVGLMHILTFNVSSRQFVGSAVARVLERCEEILPDNAKELLNALRPRHQ